ncbi:hypothetical protein TNCV_2117021 [Trichonephila clavipes]|nr:hypothetical protein TNCV_2117021 [Trichonephila clavipes]
MVDIDILMEIWKTVKKIDFVLKWLSRVGSEVGPTKGKLETWASMFRVDGFVNGILETGGVMDRCVSRCGQGTMAPWARQLRVLACYAPIGRRRRSRETLETETGEKRERAKEEKRARKKRRAGSFEEAERRIPEFCSVMLTRIRNANE